jgi:AraC-like DNA-binding protein
MAPILSLIGHNAFIHPASVRFINRALILAGMRCRPLSLDGVTLGYRHVHIGPGWIRRGYGRGAAWHIHEEIQLEYGLAGRFEFATHQQTQGVRSGDGVLVPERQQHTIRCTADGALLGILIDVSGPRQDEFVRFVGRTAAGGLLRFAPESCAWLARRILALSLPETPGAWRAEQLADLLRLWLADAFAAMVEVGKWLPGGQEDVAPLQSHAEAICDRALRFIRANCAGRIGVDDIASHAGLSVRHLNRLFAQVFHDSLNGVLMQVRLEKARDLLLTDPGLRVKEVAQAVGYEHAAHFTYSFRRAFGVPPRRLRAEPGPEPS